MKPLTRIFTAMLITIAVMTSCQKDKLKTTGVSVNNTSLTGRWRVTGQMISSGGPMYWVPATNNNEFLQLMENGAMTWTSTPDYTMYMLKDSTTLTMTNAANTKYENYIYKIKGDTLSLGAAGPVICIEGCSIQFVKVK
ncbi:hypothetical protein [Mucilaginibacter segetis]|uniref:Lipocalin-like domain-containing protein n=1 Tax=Mucilaginibacter segetis TaxID=2793071 RepID=A0A934PX08_9SPHI|nr:hypothetical protein [Mucilaginibacter segetis]MBK0380578.1 hypothetical protein [Mucilaginibacter segetis]